MNKRLLAAGFAVMLLTACNNNSADDQRSVGTRDVGFTSDQSTGYMTGRARDFSQTRNQNYTTRSNDMYQGDTTAGNQGTQVKERFGASNTNKARGGHTASTQEPTAGILQSGRGFITIDPNAYSTATPSAKYPHSQYIQGQWRVVKVQPNTGGGLPIAQAPNPATPQQQAQPTPQKATPAPTQSQTPATQAPQAANQSISAVESRVIELTNAERKKAGLSALQADTSLSNVAREKSRDMQTKGYFSHTSPTYGSPFDMMRDFGVTYRTAGENIAKGQRSAEEVVQAWMNSEGHRKNIMNPNFTHIGLGYVQSGNHWTQMFIGK